MTENNYDHNDDHINERDDNERDEQTMFIDELDETYLMSRTAKIHQSVTKLENIFRNQMKHTCSTFNVYCRVDLGDLGDVSYHSVLGAFLKKYPKFKSVCSMESDNKTLKVNLRGMLISYNPMN